MQLLHTEIDIVPGRKPQRQPLPEGYVGQGTALLRIVNTTDQENAYTIRLRCEEPYWQDAWYTLSALPPSGGQENQPPQGKPDQIGPKGQTLTIYVSRGGTRDIMISFFAPDKSEARAGLYPFKAVVETRVTVGDAAKRRKERITEIPGLAIVRPFYRWLVDVQPEDRKVGFFKRRSEFELVVTNQGNDWLYCDIKLPRPQNVFVQTPCVRLAVPPPEPGKDSIRSLPIKGITRMKNVRGEPVAMNLPMTIQRVDAPSVPPLPEEAAYGGSGANPGASVVAADTQEIGAPAAPPRLIYSPLIPASFSGFMKAIVQNAKGLMLLIIGAIVAYNLAFFMFEQLFRRIERMELTAQGLTIREGEPFRLRGAALIGSQIEFFEAIPDGNSWKVGPDTGIRADVRRARRMGPVSTSVESQLVQFTLEGDDYRALDGKLVFIGARRKGWLPGLPSNKIKFPVQVGEPPKVAKKPILTLPAGFEGGKPVRIGGENLLQIQGKVFVEGEVVANAKWTDSEIVVPIPPKFANRDSLNLKVV
ncbi:MAG TPA: hypothetical protein VM328_03385, partial [Fimbriimonadaceae bacterium]|nr:hypothetical protein [Fimbriimonadaceae bacterium]